MERNLALEVVRATEAAALAAARFIGKGDERMADRVAAEAMLKQVKTPADLAKVAADNHLTVESTGDFPNYSREIPGVGQVSGLVSAALAVPELPGVIGKVMENGGDCYIFEVVSRSAPTDAQWQSEGPAFTSQMVERQRAHAWIDFVNMLKERANIVIHPELIGTTSS